MASAQASQKAGGASIRVAIAGFGTVGSATFELIHQMSSELERRLGAQVSVVALGLRRAYDGFDFSGIRVCAHVLDLADLDGVDVLVEVIGGTGTARTLVLNAIRQGKHIVTANKALLAEHGQEIFEAAREHKVMVAFEAAVAGAIPVIKALREGLSANRIDWLVGIINGTTNYILTQMLAGRWTFEAALAQAKALGYAEADPTFDIGGIDAAHKLTLMASIAFGIELQFQKLTIEGITDISLDDIDYADQLGFKIKHLGIARRCERGYELRVHPTLIPKGSMIASVDGVTNAVMVQGHASGPTLYCGAGAGGAATASSVVADIVDIGRQMHAGSPAQIAPLGYQTLGQTDSPVLERSQFMSAYYLRLCVSDERGVMAQVASVLSERGISIEALLQKKTAGENTPIVILTHPVLEANIDLAVGQLKTLKAIRPEICLIRVEYLDQH